MSGASGASPGLRASWARWGLAPVRGHPEGFIKLGQQQPQLHFVGNGGQLHGQVVWTVTAGRQRKGPGGVGLVTPRPQTPRSTPRSTRVGAGNPQTPPPLAPTLLQKKPGRSHPQGAPWSTGAGPWGGGCPCGACPLPPSLWEGREILNAWGSS